LVREKLFRKLALRRLVLAMEKQFKESTMMTLWIPGLLDDGHK
jgi:hypothetical protein